MVDVPEEFAKGTAAREGRAGAAWIATLPGLAEELLAQWDCVQEAQVTHGGVGLVVPARRRNGDAAVLKVSFPHPGNVHEPDALAAWQGRGAVRLLERDDARFAMLLERVATATLAEVEDGDEVVRVAGGLSRRLAVPAPAGLPRLSAEVDAWEEELLKGQAEFAKALPPYVVAAAVATLRELGAVQPDTLVHGDLHPRNILRAEREPWLAVDPKGRVGDPAYDGGILLKSRALTLLEAADLPRAVHRVLDVFAESAGLDRDRVRRWAQYHAVDTVFWGLRHGFRVAREGRLLDTLNAFAERLAVLLTAPRA